MFCTFRAFFCKLGAALYLYVFTTTRLFKYTTTGAGLSLVSFWMVLYIATTFTSKILALVRGFNFTLDVQGALGYFFTYNYPS